MNLIDAPETLKKNLEKINEEILLAKKPYNASDIDVFITKSSKISFSHIIKNSKIPKLFNSFDRSSFIWDIFNFYCTYRRETSAPGLDIFSIKNKSKDIPYKNLRAMLIIYSLIKFRRDILMHKKDNIKSINTLEKRIDNIYQA